WAAGGHAQKVNGVIAHLALGISAQANKKALQLWITAQASQKIRGHGGDGVISSEALVKGFLRGWRFVLLREGCGCADRQCDYQAYVGYFSHWELLVI